MKHFTDEQIEDAFTRIRVKFEKRNNETGLEILDSYEEQWAAISAFCCSSSSLGITRSSSGARKNNVCQSGQGA